MARMRFYATEQLGPRRAVTPEGFLVCQDVAIARTGVQKYAEGETPVSAKDGVTLIHRDPEHVFRDETIASFNGKPVTDEHPREDVTPQNWKQLAIGVVMNPRKGPDGLLVADLLITDRRGIELVKQGKVEVSCGYDADYEEIGPGEGRQLNIIGNHLALVKRGRCGPRCSIGDSLETSMSSKLGKFFQRAFKAKDADELAAIEKEAQDSIGELSEPSPAVHVHIGNDPKVEGVENTIDGYDKMMKDADEKLAAHMAQNEKEHAEMRARLDALEAHVKGEKAGDEEMPMAPAEDEYSSEEMMDEMPEGEKMDPKEMKDSAKFKDAMSATMSAAEIVVPGLRMPAFDAAAAPGKTMAAMHEVRLAALEHAYNTVGTHEIVKAALGGKAFDRKRLSVRDARTLFLAVAAAKRLSNNVSAAPAATVPSDGIRAGGVNTIAELNAKLRNHKWN